MSTTFQFGNEKKKTENPGRKFTGIDINEHISGHNTTSIDENHQLLLMCIFNGIPRQ